MSKKNKIVISKYLDTILLCILCIIGIAGGIYFIILKKGFYGYLLLILSCVGLVSEINDFRHKNNIKGNQSKTFCDITELIENGGIKTVIQNVGFNENFFSINIDSKKNIVNCSYHLNEFASYSLIIYPSKYEFGIKVSDEIYSFDDAILEKSFSDDCLDYMDEYLVKKLSSSMDANYIFISFMKFINENNRIYQKINEEIKNLLEIKKNA